MAMRGACGQRHPELPGLLDAVADANNTIVATTADWRYRLYVLSWACRLRRLGVTCFVVFCLDKRLFQFLQVRSINSFHMDESGAGSRMLDTHERNALFGSVGYTSIVQSKLRHQLSVVECGHSLIFSDVDVAWIRDVRPALHAYSAAYNSDLLFQANYPQREVNSGFYFARGGPKSQSVLQLTFDAATSEPAQRATGLPRARYGDDQSSLNFVLSCGDPATGRRGQGAAEAFGFAAGTFTRAQAIAEEPRVRSIKCSLTELRVRYGVLSPTLFRNGHADTKALPRPERALILHPNFTPPGSDSNGVSLKQKRLNNTIYGRLWCDTLPTAPPGETFHPVIRRRAESLRDVASTTGSRE